MLEVQPVAFWINPYAGGTNSRFLKPSLRWRYKQCTKSCFLNQPLHSTGGTNSCFLKPSLC